MCSRHRNHASPSTGGAPAPMTPIEALTRSDNSLCPTKTSDLTPSPLHPRRHSLRPHPTDALQSSRTATSHAYNYTCNLCHVTFAPPAHPLPRMFSFTPVDNPSAEEGEGEGDGRILCEKCSTWTFSICICWTCGEAVVRGEERVAFGWCFWHWGCFACLLCAVCFFPSAFLSAGLVRERQKSKGGCVCSGGRLGGLQEWCHAGAYETAAVDG